MQRLKTPSNVAIWTALISVYIAWGSTYLAIRFAIETLPPFLMSATRFLIAGAVLYVFRRAQGDPAPTRREWRSATLIGLLLLVGGNGGVVWAQQWTPSGLAALLVSTVPLWMILLDAVHPGGRRHGRLAFTGVLIGFAGVVILIGPIPGIRSEAVVDPAAASALLLASLSWTVGSLYHRSAALPGSPLLGVGIEMLAGGVGLLLLGLATGETARLDLSLLSTRSLWGFLYLIIFGSWVGFAAYVWLLRVAPTPLVSTYAYVNPLVAVMLGHFFAQETLTSRILLATGIIVGSVALTTRDHAASNNRGKAG
ncbi:MAG: EamA family transporter [Nitrospirota bacterium]